MAMKTIHTWVAVVGILTVGAAAWWWQRGAGVERKEASAAGAATTAPAGAQAAGGAAGSGAPAVVEVARVEVARIEDDAQAVGSVRAVQTVILRPEVSGRVVRLGFTDGARVRRGQLLVQLDDTLQDAQLKQAQAQASIARTNLQRSRELLAEKFVSESAVDQNLAVLDVAQAQVALARAQLSRLAIRAPFDGAVGIRSVALGDYVKDGADLVSLEDRSRMWVDFRLPERYVGQTRTGQAVQVTLDALPGRPFVARIEALDALVDTEGRSLLVRARIDQPGEELKSGMFARACGVRGARASPDGARGSAGAARRQAVRGQGRTGARRRSLGASGQCQRRRPAADFAAARSQAGRASRRQGRDPRRPGRRRSGRDRRTGASDARRRAAAARGRCRQAGRCSAAARWRECAAGRRIVGAQRRARM